MNTVPMQTVAQLSVPAAVALTFTLFRVKGIDEGCTESLSFVRPYDPKVTDVAGYRHAVLRYRNTDNSKLVAIKAAQMVTVPQIKLNEDQLLCLNDKEQKIFLSLLEDGEDGIIRSLVDSGRSNIHWNEIGKDNALNFLTAERMSKRLTQETIVAWFAISGRNWTEQRAKQICEAKGITEEKQIAAQVAGSFNAYSARMAKLAAPVPNLGQEEATALKNMLLSAQLADDMAKVLLEKLQAILAPKIASEDL